jgi:alpha-tubulin suppressor-like RCC1 family protein/uncharacterized protein YjbI with pentapeptide repeats
MVNQQQTESIVYDVKNIDPDLTTWNEVINFWNLLVSVYNVQYIDYLGCAILNDLNWNYIIFDQLDGLDVHCPARFRASNNNTGNEDGSDWILESDGVDVKELYFTDNILNWPHSLIYTPGSFLNNQTRPPYKTVPGTVYGYGQNGPSRSTTTSGFPANLTAVAANVAANIIAVYSSSNTAFALNINGELIGWGANPYGGNINLNPSISNLYTSNIIKVAAIGTGVSALKSNGSVVIVGNPVNWIVPPRTVGNVNSNVVDIFSITSAFAALKINGAVYAWGQDNAGGNTDYPRRQSSILNSNVKKIYPMVGGFAAILSNGFVHTWGTPGLKAVWTTFNLNIPDNPSIVSNLISNVYDIKSGGSVYGALKDTGQLVLWGANSGGGNATISPATSNLFTSNVIGMFFNQVSSAILKINGSVLTFGTAATGGNANLSLPGTFSNLQSNVVQIYSGTNSFIALKADGSVFAWGTQNQGGNIDFPIPGSNVIAVYNTGGSGFAALKKNGSVFTWGAASYGGNINFPFPGTSVLVQSNVIAINSSADGFTAHKIDGTIVAWGSSVTNANIDIPQLGTRANLDSNVVFVSDGSPQGGNYALVIKAAQKRSITELTYLSNKEKIEILNNRVSRTFIIESSFNIIGSTTINDYMENGKTYKVINYQTPLNAADLLGYFYIPTSEGERVQIGDTTLVNYEYRIYREDNNFLTLISKFGEGNDVIIDNSYIFKFYPGSLLGNAIQIDKENTTTILTANVINTTYGDSIQFTANVISGNIVTGSVNFINETTNTMYLPNISLVNGNAVFTINTIPVGINRIRATYIRTLAFNSSFANIDITVASKSVTGSFIAANKIYDGNTTATIISNAITGNISTDIIYANLINANFNNSNVGLHKIVTATLGSPSLIGANSTNYTLTLMNTTTANITARTITGTFTASNKIYDGNTIATISSNTITGNISTDIIYPNLIGANFNNSNVGLNKTVTATLGSPSLIGANSTNYILSMNTTTTANITARTITGTFVVSNKDYDGNTIATITSNTITGNLTTDIIYANLIGANFNNSNVGLNKTVTATLGNPSLIGANSTNYTLIMNTTTSNITTKTITGLFTVADKEFDNTDIATVTSNSIVGNISGEIVEYTVSSAKFNSIGPGTGITVTPLIYNFIPINIPNLNNYNLIAATTTGNITGGIIPPIPPIPPIYDDYEIFINSIFSEFNYEDLYTYYLNNTF